MDLNQLGQEDATNGFGVPPCVKSKRGFEFRVGVYSVKVVSRLPRTQSTLQWLTILILLCPCFGEQEIVNLVVRDVL